MGSSTLYTMVPLPCLLKPLSRIVLLLSSFLFSFFLNDLPYSGKANFVEYAKDLTVPMPVTFHSDCSKMNSFLSEITQRFLSNSIKPILSKYQIFNFTFRHKRALAGHFHSHNSPIIDDTKFDTKPTVKYLGLSPIPLHFPGFPTSC
uniref:Uncharacterized protein n=1 Tax=Trichobilharzia regenti TaxID=157069 RepID=A0AA85JH27_TRIRE|nr:unnamed protein product [Trichobilharzia regenti]